MNSLFNLLLRQNLVRSYATPCLPPPLDIRSTAVATITASVLSLARPSVLCSCFSCACWPVTHPLPLPQPRHFTAFAALTCLAALSTSELTCADYCFCCPQLETAADLLVTQHRYRPALPLSAFGLVLDRLCRLPSELFIAGGSRGACFCALL